MIKVSVTRPIQHEIQDGNGRVIESTMKGLRISVFRDADMNCDCTLNGVSRQHDCLTLIGPDISGPDEPTEDAPAVKIVRRKLRGKSGEFIEYLHIEPIDAKYHGGRWLMFGGNVAYTSDSRFPSDYPLKIHDRFEGAE